MEFTHKSGARFVLPDRPTVKQQLEYFAESSAIQPKDRLGRMWAGARSLMLEWQCDIFPNKDAPLDTVSDPSITTVILWAGLKVYEYMNALEDLPKNS